MTRRGLPRPPRGDGRAQAAAPGRRDPLPPPRRVLGQRDGRVAGAGGQDRSRSAGQMAAVRGISHCYQRPTYPDWPYSVFTMAHGRSKEECDAILDPIADEHEPPRGGPRRPLLVDRVQEDPPALLHRRLRRVGARARRCRRVTQGGDRSAELYRRALELMPGGVNSPVRAMRAIGREHPIFIARGEGAELIDVDGNRYVDWVCSWGPLILGHAHPGVVDAVTEAAQRGTSYGAPTEGEVELAAEVADRFASVEMVRMVSSGTEASMSAIRLARAVTGRDTIVKFAGAYHGHVDGLLADAGLRSRHPGDPGEPGGDPRAGRRHRGRAVERRGGRGGRGRRARARSDHRRARAREHGGRPAGRRLSRVASRVAPTQRGPADPGRGHQRLSGRPRRRPGGLRRRGRPDDHGQGARGRAAGRGLRWTARSDGARGARRRRLPGGHPLGKPARGRGRARHAA